MKIKILKEEKEVEIDAKNPKGRDVKKGFKLFTSISKDGEENLDKLNDYMDFLDELTAQYCGMNVEKLDDLDTDEKQKLVAFYQEKIQGKMDFLRSSLKLEN